MRLPNLIWENLHFIAQQGRSLASSRKPEVEARQNCKLENVGM